MSKHSTGPSGGFVTFRMQIVQPTSFFTNVSCSWRLPTDEKVRRQLLWSIEKKHKGNAMIKRVMMVMMMMMQNTMMAGILMMFMGPSPPHPKAGKP